MFRELHLRYRLKISKFRPHIITLYQWYKKVAFPTARILLEKRQLLNKLYNNEPHDFELLRHVSVDISPHDTMHRESTSKYFNVGLSAIHCINEVLGNLSKAPEIGTILDFPSGYGRVLRFLIQRFPQAQITACEIDKRAVDYCVKHFGVRGAYSQQDLKNLSLGQLYNLIWCGSLITHLDAVGISDVLEFFHRHSAPNGILVFTTNGSFVADCIKEDSFSFTVSQEDVPSLLSSFQQSGFAYQDFPWKDSNSWKESNYGFSLTSPDWIKGELAKFNDLRIIYFGEHKWDNLQDVYGVIKAN
jgi:SAM-dependent methyltransferase